MSIHPTPCPMAGKTLQWQNEPFIVEDWWDRVSGGSWAWAKGNPAALIYAMRLIGTDIPDNDEVVYGKRGGLGHLVHVSELTEIGDVAGSAFYGMGHDGGAL